MKILIYGISGMLGHRLFLSLSENHEVYGTLRMPCPELEQFPKFNNERVFLGIDCFDEGSVGIPFQSIKPDIVINCTGIIKQSKDSDLYIPSLKINSIFPHLLSSLCEQHQARFIHFSTDCVFDGKKGNYNELSRPNALELYGKSKHLGEVSNQPHALTLRTSIVGRELVPRGSLLEWFLAQKSEVNGYKNAIFSGFPTYSIAKILNDHIIPSNLSGLYHLASNPISKYDLLVLFREIFSSNHTINEDTDFKMLRNLNAEKLYDQIGCYPKKWNDLANDLLIDNSIYMALRESQN